MTVTPSEFTIKRAARDPVVFAEELVGQPLWQHQAAVVRSPARYRMITAGRQSGKSRTLAIMALHTAYSKAGAQVLVVSAGDIAAKRLLDEVTSLATVSPLLRGSVLDETKSTLILSNGSTVLSVPASQRQIRGWAVDLLIIDEAGFVGDDIWRAAEPSVIARPGSRIVLCSSPWGGPEAFFRVLWRRGTTAPDAMYESWHWPSSVSPMVDDELLAEIANREHPDYYRREYEALWIDGAGSYFSPTELDAAVRDFEPVAPADAGGRWAVGGVDWGFSRDANTLVVISAYADDDAEGGWRYRVTWAAEEFGTQYADFVETVALSAARPWATAGYGYMRLATEQNGVGAMPSQMLARRFMERGLSPDVVLPVFTDVRVKQEGFGTLKLLLQRGLLELPRHPNLLRQLAALEYAVTESGAMKVSVPERVGHDDLAMGLCLSAWALRSPVERAMIVPQGGQRWSSLRLGRR
jgi:hypothetical protein